MACFDPLYGAWNDDGTVELKNSSIEALALDGQYVELACRNCASCRASRAREWAIRAVHEAQMHTRKIGRGHVRNGCFITLTYRPEDLPEDGSLDKQHWKNFAKKLRRDVGRFRYLHCGEYGERNGRPHYHACLFGIDFHEDRESFIAADGNTVWHSERLTETWGKGFTTVAPLNYATARYVAGYIVKKIRRNNRQFLGITAQEEYVTMSRRPGLGTSFLEKYWQDIYPRDEVIVEGKTFRPPKFYDAWLQDQHPEVWSDVLEKRESYLAQQAPTNRRQLDARRSNWHSRIENQTRRDKV